VGRGNQVADKAVDGEATFKDTQHFDLNKSSSGYT